MKLIISQPSQVNTHFSETSYLTSSLSPSMTLLFNYVVQKEGNISKNSSGHWLLELSPSSFDQNQIWILQETDLDKWLLIINDVPQFFFSTAQVLHLLQCEQLTVSS